MSIIEYLKLNLFESEISSRLKFLDDLVGSHDGQSDMKLTAMYNGEVVGYVVYVVYGDEVSISMIEVKKEYRNNGIGKELVRYLQKKFPNTEMKFGMLTSDGSALKKSMHDELFVDNSKRDRIKEVEEKIRELKELEHEHTFRINELLHKRDLSNDGDEQEEIQRQISEFGDKFNDISDEIYELEDELHTLQMNIG